MSKSPNGFDAEMADGIQRQPLDGVGYRKPPQHSRFAKGKSGNPAGRPRRDRPNTSTAAKSIQTIILEEFRRAVKVRGNGEVTNSTAGAIVARSQFKSAVEGSAYAQERILNRLERLEELEAKRINDNNIAAEHYQDQCRMLIALACREGRPEPEFIPHPDDIVIEHGKPIRFIGPLTPEDLQKCNETCRTRDVLLLQAALDDNRRSECPTSAFLLAVLLNDNLPKRMQIEEMQMMMLFHRHRGRPRRELLKLVAQAWRSLGLTVRRGTELPAIGYFGDCLEFIGNELLNARTRSGTPPSLGV